jgi:isopenicillin-N epimerase
MQQDLSSYFLLRNDITYLNFGSFGACVKSVFEKYQQYQLELEQEPVQFITANGPRYIEQSKQALGNFIGCEAKDLVFVTNPSYAVNIIAKSFSLQKGDEILTTDLEYGACDRTWNYYCEKAGAVYKRQPIQLPIKNKEDFIEQFFKGTSNKTKLVFISHITSSTGLRLPVEEICAEAKKRGLMTFVDGAHAPGQIPLSLSSLQADIYTGTCHKWMMTPKGSSFLYVKKEFQQLFDPLVISWGYKALFPSDSIFQDYHQMQGTRDFSAFLTIPAALEFMQEHNWVSVAHDCRKLTQDYAESFCALFDEQPLAPLNDAFILQLCSAPVKTKEPEKLQAMLYQNYHIEIPVMRHENKCYMRYSIQAFNSEKDLLTLFDAIRDIQKKTNFIE